MTTLLADVNIQGHIDIMVQRMQAEPWIGFWAHLELSCGSFADVGLSPSDSDAVIWHRCQELKVSLRKKRKKLYNVLRAWETLQRTDLDVMQKNNYPNPAEGRMQKKLMGLGLLSVVISVSRVSAQQTAPVSSFARQELSTSQIALSIGVLVCIAAVVWATVTMRYKQVVSEDIAFRLIGLTMVVGGALFMAAGDFSKDAVTATVGILGTALGYVFGRQDPTAVPSATPLPKDDGKLA